MCDEYAKARTFIDESLAIRRQMGDEWGIANCVEWLGSVAWAEGNYDQARSLLEESQAIQRRLGDKRAVERTLPILGNVAAGEGQYDLAGRLYSESLGTSRVDGDRRGIAQCLEGLAGVAAMSEQPVRAARLTGAAEALREAIGAPPIPAEGRAINRTIAMLRASLGDEAFEAERAVGRAMPVDLAIDEALDVPSHQVKS
jgi:tetratricopeptide (TPR) repeat protein